MPMYMTLKHGLEGRTLKHGTWREWKPESAPPRLGLKADFDTVITGCQGLGNDLGAALIPCFFLGLD